MENTGNNESALTRHVYWDEFYSNELTAFRESGNEGEEWFEPEIRAVVKWILNLPNINVSSHKVLDIGCGNGLFLIRLARHGFKHLYGCDYSPFAVELAVDVCRTSIQRLLDGGTDTSSSEDETGSSNRRDNNFFRQRKKIAEGTKIHLGVMDITMKPNELPETVVDSLEHQMNFGKKTEVFDGLVSVETPLKWGKFDFIHDKGTFDVFFMRNDYLLYIDSVCYHFVKDGTILSITSCNATQNELIECFSNNEFPTTLSEKKSSQCHVSNDEAFNHHNRRFKFECISTLTHRGFSFGGSTGQVVSTVAFRAILV